MPENDESDVRLVAESIAGYLRTHPNAADTVGGIAEWWLPSIGIKAAPAVVLKALDDLCARSVVVRHSQGNGNAIYSAQQAPDE